MLETYKVGVVLELGGNVQSGIDKLITQMEALDRRAKDAGSTFGKLASDINAIGAAGRNIDALSRAMGRLSSGGNRGVADFERMATAAQSMTTASERMTAALRDSAKLAADVARATETASRASSTVGRASGRGHGGGGHDLMLAGLGASAVGATLTRGSETAFERGMEVAHLRTQILTDTRVTPAQADALIAKAYDATASAPGTRVASNVGAAIDLKQLTGSLDEAQALLPGFARLSAMLQVVDRRKGGSGDPAFAAGKAMELLGGMVEERQVDGHTVRDMDGGLLQKRLDMIARVAVATNGRVAPQDFLGFARQARSSGMLLSDEFIYEKLPAIMLGMGGPRAGTALMSAAQVFEGGKLTAKSMEALQGIGLAGAGGVTTDAAGKKTVHSDAIFDLGLLRTDPSKWMEAAQGRMETAGIHGTSDQIVALMRASQRSTIAGLLADLLKDAPVIAKEQANIRATRPDVASYIAQNDPAAKLQQMQAAMDKLFTTLGSAGMEDLVRVMNGVTGGLNDLSAWAGRNPNLSRVIVDTAAGLGAVATALGTLSTAVFLFGPALRLLGIGGGTAAGGAAAGGVGGWLGTASRAAMGGAGVGAAAVGAAIYLGGTTDPIEAERRLNLTRQQQRAGANLSLQDGFGPDGRPVSMTGTVNLDSKQVGTFVGKSLARGASGPSGGTTGFDIRAGTAGGLGAIP